MQDFVEQTNQQQPLLLFIEIESEYQHMRLKFLTCVLIVASTFLTACETMTASKRIAVSTDEKWAILPIQNLSKTPLAGTRAAALVETHLRAQGVRNVELYKAPAEQSLMTLLDDAGQISTALQWAKDNGFTYAVTGNVQEWQYKNGLDNEPSVGLSLKFIHVKNDEVMWIASASRTGWGYNNLSKVASKTIEEIVAEVRFRPSRPAPMIARTPAPSPVVPTVQNTITPAPLPAATNTTALPEPVAAAAKPAPGSTETLPSPYETNLRDRTNR